MGSGEKINIGNSTPGTNADAADREEGKSSLTEMQRKILSFISNYTAIHGYAPAVRDIGKAVGLASTSSVYSQLVTLEEKGCVKKDPDVPRSIFVTAEEYRTPNVMPRRMIPVVKSLDCPEWSILEGHNISGYCAAMPGEAEDRDAVYVCHTLKEEYKGVHGHGLRAGDLLLLRLSEAVVPGRIHLAKENNGNIKLHRFMDGAACPDGAQVIGTVESFYRSIAKKCG